LKWGVLAVAIVVVAYMAAVSWGFVHLEQEKKPVVAEKLSMGDYRFLYDFYLAGEPQLNHRKYLGDQKAMIFIIVYGDPKGSTWDQYMQEYFPLIMHDYVDTGIARYYHKSIVSAQDNAENNERFKYAKALMCHEGDLYNYYLDYYNKPADTSIACMQKDVPGIIEDVSETENFGISTNPTFYIGMQGTGNTVIEGMVPYRRFARAVKEYQTLLGD